MCPCGTVLVVQPDIVLCDLVRNEQTVTRAAFIRIGKVFPDELAVDGAVDHDMRNMDAVGAEFTRHGLGERPQRVLGAGKG